jgi:hypothetical protein
MTTTEISERAVLAVPVDRVWDVIHATHRYADWVDGVLDVTRDHGPATVGETYEERNRTVGPLTTRSVWTVREIDPERRRVDTGIGFAPLHNLTNIFELRPAIAGGRPGTEMTYAVRYRMGLGPLGRFFDRLQRPGLRKSFQRSMQNLEQLVLAEGSAG